MQITHKAIGEQESGGNCSGVEREQIYSHAQMQQQRLNICRFQMS